MEKKNPYWWAAQRLNDQYKTEKCKMVFLIQKLSLIGLHGLSRNCTGVNSFFEETESVKRA